jgi:predicted HAD superfamily Cof-like phosphohydrolase
LSASALLPASSSGTASSAAIDHLAPDQAANIETIADPPQKSLCPQVNVFISS